MAAGTTGLTSDFISKNEESMTNSFLYDLVNQVYIYSKSEQEAPKDKIFEAVEKCVEAMSELTIAESKVARQQLDSVMEEMYKRSPDTIIGTIQHSLQA